LVRDQKQGGRERRPVSRTKENDPFRKKKEAEGNATGLLERNDSDKMLRGRGGGTKEERGMSAQRVVNLKEILPREVDKNKKGKS